MMEACRPQKQAPQVEADGIGMRCKSEALPDAPLAAA
jgi:hypothetical protein